MSDARRDLEAGWALAQDLGRPVAPLLWDQARREGSNVDKRLALLIAALLAGGVSGDDRLFDFMSQQKPLLQERTMASLWIALGPRRNRPRPDVVKRLLGPNCDPMVPPPGVLAVAPKKKGGDLYALRHDKPKPNLLAG